MMTLFPVFKARIFLSTIFSFPNGTSLNCLVFPNKKLLLNFRVMSSLKGPFLRWKLLPTTKQLTLWNLLLPKSFRRQLELLVSEKTTLGVHYSQVDSKLDGTLQQNEALSIRVESLEIELLEKEKMLLDREAELSLLGSDLDWMVKDGIVRILDKIIEITNFFQGVGRVKNMCFPAGEESSRVALRKAVVAETFDPSAASSTSSHSGKMVDAID
ncbi:unnamed protein product [Lactuca virosa]|uniref:Uncharacterized protein n=1 Tax=Lactuca virosa TaxID=75947 RepID=A0AAU9M5M5_9ASTR|nr:unnamed protein product [Lactuca virosa]